MNQVYKYLTAFSLLTAIAAGCSKEPVSAPVSHTLAFGVSMADMDGTKADAEDPTGLFTATDLRSLEKFKILNGYDNDTQIITSATDVYKIAENLWQFDENPKAWVIGHTMTFWASANLPSWVESASSTAKGEATMKLKSDGIPTTAATQGDPLIGYFSSDTGDNGKATIRFFHPMTAVRFTTGELGEPQKVASITSVTLEGVYKEGTATVTGGSPAPTITWSPTGEINVSGDFEGTGAEGKSAQPFILIPQDLDTNEITIKVNVNLQVGGTQVMSAVMSSGKWEAGYLYTYELDYVPISSIDGTLTVTLKDWTDLMSEDGDKYFDVTFGNRPDDKS